MDQGHRPTAFDRPPCHAGRIADQSETGHRIVRQAGGTPAVRVLMARTVQC